MNFEEKILGRTNSFPGLLRLLALEEKGVIIIEGMIDCSDHELNLYNGQTLRGNKPNSGLKFTYKSFASTAVHLYDASCLDNINLTVKTEKASRRHDHAAIVIDGCPVRLKNLTIDLTVEDDDISSEKFYSAVYLRYCAEAEGVFHFNLHGRLAAAVSGNSLTASAIKFKKAEVFINSFTSVRPLISQCLIEFDNSALNYFNESINPPREEIFEALVYFIGSTAFNYNCLSSPKFEMEDETKKKQRLLMVNNLPLKKTPPRFVLKKFKFWP